MLVAGPVPDGGVAVSGCDFSSSFLQQLLQSKIDQNADHGPNTECWESVSLSSVSDEDSREESHYCKPCYGCNTNRLC